MTPRRVVYEIIGMTQATATTVECATGEAAPLTTDVYRLPRGARGRAPAASLVMGYSDVDALPTFGARLSEWEV